MTQEGRLNQLNALHGEASRHVDELTVYCCLGAATASSGQASGLLSSALLEVGTLLSAILIDK